MVVAALSCVVVAFGAQSRPAGTIEPIAPARLDLNRASVGQLRVLPGIGPARAERIVELRERLGGFRNVRQLERVHGIGPKTVEGVEPYVRIEPVR